jgi:hypothetical protein
MLSPQAVPPIGSAPAQALLIFAQRSRDAVLITDAGGRVTWINAQCAKLIGVDPAAALGRPALALLSCEHTAQTWPAAAGARCQIPIQPAGRHALRIELECIAAPEETGEHFVYLLRGTDAHDTAAQRNADLALRLALASKAGRIGLWEHSLTSASAHWNDETFALYGLPPGSPTPTRDEWRARFVHPDDRATQRAAAEHAIRTLQPYDHEHRIVRADGEVRWVHSRAHYVGDGDGSGPPTRALGATIDITERKHTEAQLRATVARLQLAGTGSGIGIFERRLDRVGAYWSEELFRLYGLPPSTEPPAWPELLARVHPDDRTLFERQWQALIASETFIDSEFRILRPDLPEGERERWLLTRGRREADAASGLVRVVGVAIDITAHKRVELRAGDLAGLLHLTASAIGMGMWQRDLVTGKVQWDATMKRLFGLPVEGPPPTRDEYLAMIAPEDRAAVTAHRDSLPLHGRGDELAFSILRADGRTRRVLARRAVQQTADGVAVRLHGILIDITDLHRTQAELRDTRDRLALATEASRIATWERDVATGAGKWDLLMFGLYGLRPGAAAPPLEDVVARIVPEDRHVFREGMARVQEDRDSHEWEFRVVRPDGSIAHLLSRAQAQRGADGRPVRIVGAAMDLTATRRAQFQLQDLTEWMRLAGEAAGVGFFRLKLDGTTLYADRQMRAHYGLPPDSPLPQIDDFLRHVLPEDAPRIHAARARSQQTDQPFESEYRVRDPVTGCIRHLVTRRVRLAARNEIVGAVIDVTESRNAQLALAAANERLALATRVARVGIWEWDLTSGTEIWDARMREIHGVTEAWQPNLEAWTALLHPDDRERARRPFVQDLTHLSGGESEHRIVLPGGDVRTILSSYTVVRDANGAALRVLGTDLDVTEARRTQSEHEALSRRVDLMAREVGIGLWEWDLVHDAGVWNQRMFTLFGRTPDFEPRRWLEAVHPDDRETARAHLIDALRSGELFESQFRVVWPDGTVRWTASRGHVERDAGGAAVRMAGVNWDVTELLRSDQERRQLVERLGIAASGAGIGFWTFDPVTRTGYIDDRTLALYGRTRAEDPDFAHHWLRYVHDEDRDHIATLAAHVLESDDPIDAQYRAVQPDGRIRHLAVRARRSRGVDGRLTVNGVNWDVTEQHQALAALRDKELAERASAAKTEFLSRMSHELRTPLNAILGFAQILEIDSAHPLDPAQRERLMHIQKAGWHLLSLINEILDLSRIEAGKAQLAMDAVPLGEVVEECLALVAAAAAQRRLVVTNALDRDGPSHAWADRVRLKQVLLNLLSNAVKYNRDGGTILVRSDIGRDGQVVIAVCDTGLGLSEQQLAQIFEPFNRLGLETAPIEGTGIGLTIAHKLTVQMGGTLEVSSEVGTGSEFRVVLQAALPAPPLAAPDHGPSQEARRDVTGSVLYVEDNPANVAVIEHALSLRPGVKLFVARDGASGLVMAAVCQPDLALLDLRLPDTDGIALIGELHAAAATRTVPCVAVSANASPADIEAVRRAGFVDFWPKPVQLDTLLAGIDHWLTRRTTR